MQFDHQRQKVLKQQRKLEWQITGTHSAELECAGVLDPNTSPELMIRSLEYKLCRVQMKMHDVQILVKHYEGTLLPLREEWIFYDAKLAALQGHVNIKNQECELLINTHHDAIRARDAAKNELEELLAFLIGYNKKGIISPELRARIWKAIQEIKSVMDVESMREMYHQYLVQEKQSSYLGSIYEDMSRTLDLMRSDDYGRTRKKSSIRNKEYAERIIEGTTTMVRRQSAWKGSLPLLQILGSTKALVNRLHEGQVELTLDHTIQKEILEKCKDSMVKILQSLYRQMKKKNKEAVRKAEYEAKEAAHWAKEEAEVARKKVAAEEARRKYEKRAAAREAEREEKAQALRQMTESEPQAEAPHKIMEEEPQPQAQLLEHPSTQVPEVITQQEIVEEIVSREDDQQPKETAQADEIAVPTVIFLPSFPQAPSDDKEILARRESATFSSSHESEAPSPTSAVMSDDESGAASTVDDGRHKIVATPSEVVARLPIPETGPPAAASSRLGHAATFKESRTPSATASSTRIKLALDRAATFTETGRPPAVSGRISKSPDVGKVSPPDQDKGVTSVAETLLESEQLPTGIVLAGEEGVDFKETVQVMSEERLESREPSPTAQLTSEETALPDLKSPGVGTIDQVSATEPTTGPGVSPVEKSASPERAPSKSPPVAALEVPITEAADSPEKAAAQQIVEALATDVPIIASEPKTPFPETVPSDETLTPRTPEGGLTSPSVPTSPSGAPIATESQFAAPIAMPSDETIEAPMLKEEPASTASSSDAPVLIEGAEILSQPGPAGADVSLPSSPCEVPKSAAEVQAAEVLPSTPRDIPGGKRTSIFQGKAVSGSESEDAATSHTRPHTAEVILPRSPSGAPVASLWEQGGVAKVPSPETVSLDETLQPQSFGGLRSPNLELPRSPSGAPVATAARFPFGSHLSETLSPAGFSGMGRSPIDTARLPTTAPEEPVPSEASLQSEKGTEPVTPGTSDP
ncbi:unnamed protein product [Calypogeia fissa]